jgi:hypothetical protein
MRRFTVTAVLAFVILVMLAPPVLAQAPAPKVTISGLFDQVTGAGRNVFDGNLTRNSDTEWYGRTRFRPDFEFAVGRVRAVLGIEIDLAYGQMGSNDGGFPGNVSGSAGGFGAGTNGATPPGCKVNTNGCLDINTDVGGMLEVKWIYTEFPLTGKDSLLPFIPVETMSRAGGQPFDTLAQYKLAQYANGDFAGISAVTTFTPNIKSNLAWVIIEDQLGGSNRGLPAAKTGRGEDSALIASIDLTPTKGLDLKPLFSWIHTDGQSSGALRRNNVNRNSAGGSINATASLSPAGSAAGDPSFHENRYTVGADARWRLGGFGLDPTFYYQFGHAATNGIDTSPGANGVTTKKQSADISAFLLDVIGSYQLGPLLLEARGAYSSGNRARDNLATTRHYYQPLDTDGNYFAGGWTHFWASSPVDYFSTGWAATGNFVGYDRYGRVSGAFRATYSFTPALSLQGLVHALWTAEAVDTDTGVALGSGTGTPIRTIVSPKSFAQGDSNYLGTELALLLTWRFSANTSFDTNFAYLFAGDALDATECINGTTAPCSLANSRTKAAQDAWLAGMRVRLAF